MKIAIVGATGKVGRMMMTCLEEYDIQYDCLDLYASASSEGKVIEFQGKEYTVKTTTKEVFNNKYDYVLFSAGGAVAKEFAPYAAEAGSVVIDNSSAFRKDPAIPLVVPEINGHLLKGYRGIVANPNCSTIQLVLILHPLNAYKPIDKVVVTTMQSVSGTGYKGIIELQNQRQGLGVSGLYPRQIDLNVIPQIMDFNDDGYSGEEAKMSFESRKILGVPELNLVATNVRVPVIYGHSEAVYVQWKEAVELSDIMAALSNAPTVKIDSEYITPIEIGESNLSHISRLRYAGDDKSILFWNVAHNVRLGAAANAVKILRELGIRN